MIVVDHEKMIILLMYRFLNAISYRAYITQLNN